MLETGSDGVISSIFLGNVPLTVSVGEGGGLMELGLGLF